MNYCDFVCVENCGFWIMMVVFVGRNEMLLFCRVFWVIVWSIGLKGFVVVRCCIEL